MNSLILQQFIYNVIYHQEQQQLYSIKQPTYRKYAEIFYKKKKNLLVYFIKYNIYTTHTGIQVHR
jgi:hypothetical protein